METALVEINLGYIALNRFSSTSKKLELLSSRDFKYDQILNKLLTKQNFGALVDYIQESLLLTGGGKVGKFWVIAVGNFPPLFIQRVRNVLCVVAEDNGLERFYISFQYINDKMWTHFAKDYVCDEQVSLWLERKYVKVGYIKYGRIIVDTLLVYDDLNLDEKTIAKRIILHDLPCRISGICVMGDIKNFSEVQLLVCRVFSRLYEGSTWTYDSVTFAEMYVRKLFSNRQIRGQARTFRSRLDLT